MMRNIHVLGLLGLLSLDLTGCDNKVDNDLQGGNTSDTGVANDMGDSGIHLDGDDTSTPTNGDTGGNEVESEPDADADGYTASEGDCDDMDDTVYPDANEICDEKDNDCDGQVDEDPVDGTMWYVDLDDDGYGDDHGATQSCDEPLGTIEVAGDCDDTDPAVNPDAEDYCGDDQDTNCSGDETDCIELTLPEVHDMITCTDTPEALRVSGDYLDISYNIHGLWNDSATEMGLQMSDGTDWVDVTYPGTPMALQIMTYQYDEGSDWEPFFYSDGGRGALDDWVPDCANAISVGDVIGVIHEYTQDYTHVVKTELWKRDEGVLRVWYEVTNIGDSIVAFPTIQNVFDPDIDAEMDSDGDGEADEIFDTIFYATADQRYLVSVGPASGWSLGVGICDGTWSYVFGADWPWGPTDPTEVLDTCNPDEEEMDILLGWWSGVWSVDVDESFSDGFILTTSTGELAALEAASIYASQGPELCGMTAEEWVEDDLPSTECAGFVTIPDLPDLPDGPDLP